MYVFQVFFMNNKNLMLIISYNEAQLYDIDDGIKYICNIKYNTIDSYYFFKINDELFLTNNFQLLKIEQNPYDVSKMSLDSYYSNEIINKKGTLHYEYCVRNSFCNID